MFSEAIVTHLPFYIGVFMIAVIIIVALAVSYFLATRRIRQLEKEVEQFQYRELSDLVQAISEQSRRTDLFNELISKDAQRILQYCKEILAALESSKKEE